MTKHRGLRYLLGLLLVLVACQSVLGGTANVWLTRGDQGSLLQNRPDVTFQAGIGSHSTIIEIDSTISYQVMDGFGASLTESSAWLMENELTVSARDNLIQEFFSASDGIGISAVRICMGASDFALSEYTYNDLPAGLEDWNLDSFSTDRDTYDIVPVLQDAMTCNPNLFIIASPWSPPAWMKDSGVLRGGSLRWNCHSVYADYFVRFIQDYLSYGLEVNAVTVQNEPLQDSTALPSAGMPTHQQSAFIGDNLGPAFSAAGIDTKILCFDHNWEDWNYPLVVLNDPETALYTSAAAFHGYAGDVSAQSSLYDFFMNNGGRETEIYFTEISGGGWAPNFADNLVWGLRNIIIGATRNWAKTSIYWNLALDQNSGPFLPGGCSNCRGVVTINTNTGSITREVEYYIIAHAAKFVQPGAKRIYSDSVDGTIETVAFRNPDGTEVLIALNPTDSSQWFDVQRGDEYFAYRLVRKSVATFIWDAAVPGDFDNNGVVNFDDIDDGVSGDGNSLFDYLNQAPPLAIHDLVATGASAGIIDQADQVYLVENILGSVIGDLNRDFEVTLDDYEEFRLQSGSSSNYFEGDLNADSSIDLKDFAVFQLNFSRIGTSY